jgi:hypothetical protein
MYETNNNGRWYDFGFCIGAWIIFGHVARWRMFPLIWWP